MCTIHKARSASCVCADGQSVCVWVGGGYLCVCVCVCVVERHFNMMKEITSVSHFTSCCQQNPTGPSGAPQDAPRTLPVPSAWPAGCPLEQLGLARMPRRKDG